MISTFSCDTARPVSPHYEGGSSNCSKVSRATAYQHHRWRVRLHADVATPPPNAFSFGKLKRNKRNGTAILAVAVPGAGTIALTGDDVRQQPPKETGLTAPGVVKLKVKAVGNGLFKLRHTGKAKVKVTVTYTPVGDLAAPNTESTRVKLVERR
jgi:hypothetical protein